MGKREILSAVRNTPESITEAREVLTALGLNHAEADFEIFIALGGTDVIMVDDDGVEYYDHGDGNRVRVDSIRWPKRRRAEAPGSESRRLPHA